MREVRQRFSLAPIVLALVALIVRAQLQDHHQQANTKPRIGLAPQDRPACQLPPIISHRRHTTSGDSTNTLLVEPGRLSGVLVNNVSTQDHHHLSISTPNVLSLEQTLAASAASSPPIAPNSLGSHQQAQHQSLTGRDRPLRADTSERLRQLRQLIVSNNYDGYLVTPNDEHGSEYLADYDRRLRFLTGFTGSNGYALVLLDRAILFTDGRYSLQADQELDCNWWLVVGDEQLADITAWLGAYAPKGLKIAIDARLIPLHSFDYLDEQFRKQDTTFALISSDLVDVVWSNWIISTTSSSNNNIEHRVPPNEPLSVHPIQFAADNWQDKVIRVTESMAKLKARHYIMGQLDDIAWMLNLRGSDIPSAPLFKSFVILSRTPATSEPVRVSSELIVNPLTQFVSSSNAAQQIRLTLYVEPGKVTPEVRDHLRLDGNSTSNKMIQVEVKPYSVFFEDLRSRLTPGSLQQFSGGKLLIDAGANVAIHVLAKSHEDRLVLCESIGQRLKAVKSDSEVNGMRLAHWRDSLAISMLLAQLDSDIRVNKLTQKWTEISAAKELEFYRSLMDYNRGQSFPSISAYGPNAAIVHYDPKRETDLIIGNQSTYLLDSGGQYLDGTTDITRTLHFGRPTEFQRETYTRVLMGAIDMMSLVFERSQQRAYRLNDLTARRHLLDIGLDYAHGTGHGIGLYSLVHEAPALIEHYVTGARSNERRQSAASKPTAGSNQLELNCEPVQLQANMFSSVEPGYYRAGEFGIRLENIVVTQRALAPTKDANNYHHLATKELLRFEPISLVPFEPRLIKSELLSNKQKAWLNSYNLMVRLRMTQQINYYLAKIRSHRSQSLNDPTMLMYNNSTEKQEQHQSWSRMRQQQQQQQQQQSVVITPITGTNNRSTTNAAIHNEQQSLNFLQMDLTKLQEKLEHTHKWVMAHTELIALDVPQHMMQTLPLASKSQHDTSSDNWSSEHATGQRLMLAYMSAMPFNDADAGEAFASLNSRSGSQTTDGSNSNSNKCAGLDCDLWLLGALNAHHAQQRDQQRAPTSSSSSSSSSWDAEQSSDSSSSSFMDLFTLSAIDGRQTIPINVWWLLGMVGVVLIQLAIIGYICTSHGKRRPRANIAHSRHCTPQRLAEIAT